MSASKGPYLTPAEFQQTNQTTLGLYLIAYNVDELQCKEDMGG